MSSFMKIQFPRDRNFKKTVSILENVQKFIGEPSHQFISLR